MRFWFLISLLALSMSCGPRKTTTVHFISFEDTNRGRALPVHVIPIDDNLRAGLETMPAEEWFRSDEERTLRGIFKTALTGPQNESAVMTRANNKNDFLIVVDYADVVDQDLQKLLLGENYRRAKNVYILVGRDRISVVEKSVFQKYLTSN